MRVVDAQVTASGERSLEEHLRRIAHQTHDGDTNEMDMITSQQPSVNTSEKSDVNMQEWEKVLLLTIKY